MYPSVRKMAEPWILGLYVLSLLVFNIHCRNISPPPSVAGSYRAIGELSTTVQISENASEVPVQVAFEEDYDKDNQMMVYTVWENGKNDTFVEDLRKDTTFQYIENSQCQIVTKEDWVEIEAPPSLLGFVSDNRIRFAVQKLLTINSSYLTKSSTNETFRGIPANIWVYEMRGKENGNTAIVTIYAYWSNSTWNTTSGVQTPVPLGYEITKLVEKEKEMPTQEMQIINIFSFVEGSVNKGAFEAREGLYCEGGNVTKEPFPAFPKIDALSIRSEIAVAAYLEVKHVDIWYDMKNKLLRIDMDRITKQEPEYLSPGRRITSEFTSKELGATFEIDIYKGKFTCEVTKIDDYEFEAQDIINPKLDAKAWDLGNFFGANTTDYRYIGKAVKRNIPCHIFQGRRTDWPEKSAKTTSLWEWCLAVNRSATDDVIVFRDKELPLVSLQIYFEESTDVDFPAGSRLVHHFYDALAEDPNVMYGAAFDVSRCFQRDQKKKLQFTVDAELNDTNIHIFENATSNPSFLQLWRDQIYAASGLTIGSLRIARVRSVIYNKIMIVTFILLDVHPELPNKSKYKSLADAQKDLNNSINSGSVKIKYFYQPGKYLDLAAKNQSLGPQVDPTTMVHEKATTSPPPITKSLTTTTETSVDKSSKDVIPGHGPGTVAGVSIAMIVVGLSIGAGGTYFKYRGLPMWCRRA